MAGASVVRESLTDNLPKESERTLVSGEPRREAAPHTVRVGVLYGLAAYFAWGFIAVYFKAVAHVPALEVLAHRIVWSVAMLLAWLAWKGRLGDLRAAFTYRGGLLTLFGSTALIACNWFIFIWAVAQARVLEASLGYFINPLVNVILGFVFLHERLRRWQWASVGLAASGVLYLTLSYGQVPVISLVLASTFGLYGLLRKTMQVDGLVGLTVETILLLPVSAGYLLVLAGQGSLVFAHLSPGTDLLLALAGVVTALPLLWFANAVRRLPLATVGILQYIAPTLQFLLAVVAFGEPFTRDHLIAFLAIWSALALYSADAWRHGRPGRRAPEAL